MKKLSKTSSQTELFTEPRYLLAEKQLASIPFWEPKKKGRKETSNVKVVALTSMIQGEPIKLTLKVLAGGDYGFPNTTDLEFFRAFEDILTERLLQQGELKNPIGVTGREMLAAVHRAPGGTGYRELRRFFGKLHALSFEVERTQGSKHKMGRFHLFHAMFHEGEKREDGTITEMNEIEVAPWYLKSLQAGNCLVIDHALFQRLSLSLSKLLHQFLHAQFHFHQGVATEWYADIAKNWQMKEYSALSRIKQQLDPSHEELKRVGFLESWDYLSFKRAGKKVYQIRWHAGPQWVAVEQVQKTEYSLPMEQPSESLLFLEAKQDQVEAEQDQSKPRGDTGRYLGSGRLYRSKISSVLETGGTRSSTQCHLQGIRRYSRTLNQRREDQKQRQLSSDSHETRSQETQSSLGAKRVVVRFLFLRIKDNSFASWSVSLIQSVPGHGEHREREESGRAAPARQNFF